MPVLERIRLYPVKSLDGVEVEVGRVLAGTGLTHDRRWRLLDMDGREINGKRCPALHAIRAAFELEFDPTGVQVPRRVSLAVDSARTRGLPDLGEETFPLRPGSDGPCGWLSEALGFPVLLQERVIGGFPDDRDAAGPTLVATASLIEVGRWFGLEIDECRRRFRANLEIGRCDAFWEDALASPLGDLPRPSLAQLPEDLPTDPYADPPPPEPRAFMVGSARFAAANVCRRCPVPGRDSFSGEENPRFRELFELRRRATLRDDVDASGWGTLYRLSLNTHVIAAGDLAVGDPVLPL
jgi:uncharacterized protein YcbX